MIIKNLDKAQSYQLTPGTQLEVERTNPFFNDYGEQTVPVSLPASPHNCMLLDHPELAGRKAKATAINALIQDGAYCAECRQYVLSAQEHGSIETSFYLNDGSFYSRIQDTRLKDIFKEDSDTIAFDSVAAAISYMRSLRSNTDSRLAVFPVLVTDDSGSDTGFNYKVINGWGREDTGSVPFYFNSTASDCDFYNAKARKETIDGKTIDIAAGYYISPFVRANYVLRRVISYYGYTLDEKNILFTEKPFDKMVLLNSCIDTIVNAKIRLADLVPDVAVSDFVNLYRKKFCCEFVPDEGKRTMSIVFFRDLENAPVDVDLSDCLTGRITYEYKQAKDYSRLVLKSKQKVSSEIEDSYEDIKSLINANPTSSIGYDGAIYKIGYVPGPFWTQISTKVAESSMDFNSGEDDKEETEIEIPELIPEFRTLVYSGGSDTLTFSQDPWLYIGDYIALNSKIVLDNQSQNNKEDANESAQKQYLMLAATFVDADSRPKGTITVYDPSENALLNPIPKKLFDYALHYYGPYGIFEKFYRRYDTLLRNALHKTKASLLLSQLQKQNIPACAKVTIHGVPYVFDKLKFTLGGINEPAESDLLTIKPSTPVDETPWPHQMFYSSDGYRWELVKQLTASTKEQYEKANDSSNVNQPIYPPKPSAEWVGKKYGYRSAHLQKMIIDPWGLPSEYSLVEWWLECRPLST